MFSYPTWGQIKDDVETVVQCFEGCPKCDPCQCERAVWALAGFAKSQNPECPFAQMKKGAAPLDKTAIKNSLKKALKDGRMKTGAFDLASYNIPWSELFGLLIRSIQEGLQLLLEAK